MTFTVFYSWQSDRAETRELIREALREALDSFAAELQCPERPELQSDTTGVPGTPDIAATIFRRIDECGIFVADLTYVDEPGGRRRHPNPNVLIELGYAFKALPPERILLVMNTRFGGFSRLPFDLRYKRAPEEFSWNETSERAGVLERLSGQLQSHIKAAAEAAGLLTGAADDNADAGRFEDWWSAGVRTLEDDTHEEYDVGGNSWAVGNWIAAYALEPSPERLELGAFRDVIDEVDRRIGLAFSMWPRHLFASTPRVEPPSELSTARLEVKRLGQFWRASTEGMFFASGLLPEDREPPDLHYLPPEPGDRFRYLDYICAIQTVGECFVHAGLLCHALHYGPQRVRYRIKWNGIRNRYIGRMKLRGQHGPMPGSAQCTGPDQVTIDGVVPAIETREGIPDLVDSVLRELFQVFGLAPVPPMDTIRSSLRPQLALTASS